MDANDTSQSSWQELVIAGIKAVDDISHRVATALAEVLGDADTWLEAAQPALSQLGEAALKIRDAYDEGVPSGWGALNTREMIEVVDLMSQTGWCLTTSPPADTLKKLLLAHDSAERGHLLLAAEGQILHDLDIELRSAESHELHLFALAARQAWDSHAGGLFLASQALSSASLGALSDRRGPLGFRNLGSARSRLAALNIEEAGLREFRFIAVARAVSRALETFPREGPEPDLFNRHASAHGISAVQFTQLNSLTALMLFCGWLREILWLSRVARAEVTSSDAGAHTSVTRESGN